MALQDQAVAQRPQDVVEEAGREVVGGRQHGAADGLAGRLLPHPRQGRRDADAVDDLVRDAHLRDRTEARAMIGPMVRTGSQSVERALAVRALPRGVRRGPRGDGRRGAHRPQHEHRPPTAAGVAGRRPRRPGSAHRALPPRTRARRARPAGGGTAAVRPPAAAARGARRRDRGVGQPRHPGRRRGADRAPRRLAPAVAVRPAARHVRPGARVGDRQGAARLRPGPGGRGGRPRRARAVHRGDVDLARRAARGPRGDPPPRLGAERRRALHRRAHDGGPDCSTRPVSRGPASPSKDRRPDSPTSASRPWPRCSSARRRRCADAHRASAHRSAHAAHVDSGISPTRIRAANTQHPAQNPITDSSSANTSSTTSSPLLIAPAPKPNQRDRGDRGDREPDPLGEALRRARDEPWCAEARRDRPASRAGRAG